MTNDRKSKNEIILIMAILLCLLLESLVGIEVSAEEKNTIVFHYQREDDNYDGWDIWCWSTEGNYSGSIEFGKEDSFGKIAILKTNKSIDELGFIMRYNHWEDKDGEDRFITEFKDGVAEVWVYAGKEEYETICPQGYKPYSEAIDSKNEINEENDDVEEMIKVNVHYHRYDENYNNWDVFMWEEYKEGSGIEFNGSDEFGKVATAYFSNNSKVIGAIIRKKDWAAKDGDIDRIIDLSKAKNGILDVWIISGDQNTYYEKKDIDKAPDEKENYSDIFDTAEFENKYTYYGKDLGANWTKSKTTFKIWAPTATKVRVKLYKNGTDGSSYSAVDMIENSQGVWSTEITGDLNKIYYTYEITTSEGTNEIVDPYARTTGINGKRGMIIDLSSTNPKEWSQDKRPFTSENSTDACIYEIHIRDFTIDNSSGVLNKGKYIGLSERGTKNSAGQATALDYLKELGITHVQLMPIQDFSITAIDENDNNKYNWGYDVCNYNVPEGTYSTNPSNGEVRVKELKQMIQALHNEGIAVVMNVIYGYTAEVEKSCLNIAVPGYFYRMNEDGSYTNGSGYGNELATERTMVKKYIVDSVLYWANEYHIDGFSFDLMGLMDLETINEIKSELNKIDPSIIIYGEPWGMSSLNDDEQVSKTNMRKISDVAAYSDDIRDGIKGSVYSDLDKGFVTGSELYEVRIKTGVIGAVEHGDVDYTQARTDINMPWASNPTQTINYVSSHDNLTLWDKINTSNKNDKIEDRIKMNKLAASIIYTAQGTPFMLGGEEIFRTKPSSTREFDSNSYKSSDETNSIKWDTLNDSDTQDLLDYYKGLIEFRKEHAGLRMTTAEDVQNNLKFLLTGNSKVIAYVIDNKPNGEISDSICVIYNADSKSVKVKVPLGNWKVCIKNGKAGTEVLDSLYGSEITVEAISCLVMVKGEVKMPNNIVIPSFSGKTEQEVVENLKEIGLVPIIEYRVSDTVEKGKVITQSIIEGEAVLKGTEIKICISLGKDVEEMTTLENEITDIEDKNEQEYTGENRQPTLELEDNEKTSQISIGFIVVIIVAVIVVILSIIVTVFIIKKKRTL